MRWVVSATPTAAERSGSLTAVRQLRASCVAGEVGERESQWECGDKQKVNSTVKRTPQVKARRGRDGSAAVPRASTPRGSMISESESGWWVSVQVVKVVKWNDNALLRFLFAVASLV
eukprot:1619048-Amphidinium_carterae.2